MIKVDIKTILIWAVIVILFLLFARGDFVVLRSGWLNRLSTRVLSAVVTIVFLGATFLLAVALRFALRTLSR